MKKVYTSDGYEILVDDEDYHLFDRYKWMYRSRCVYRIPTIGPGIPRKKLTLTKAIMNTPEGMVVDHINHNPLDNRRENLRICTWDENNLNKRPHKGKRYKGVCFKRKWFYAYIKYRGETHHLGIYKDEKDAAFMRNLAAVHFHGKFAYINDINFTEG